MRRFQSFAMVPILWTLSMVITPHTLFADAKQQASEILSQTGVTGGFFVHLGVGTGELTAALRQGDGVQVQGLDRDATVVQKARELIRKAGDYGDVAVDQIVGSQLPYIDNLVNLMVIEDQGDVPQEEVPMLVEFSY